MELDNSKLISCKPSLFLNSLKSEYCQGEKVLITVVLANPNPQPLVVNKRFQMIVDYKYREAYELRFEIIKPNRAFAEPRMILEDRLWPYPRSDDFAELPPNSQRQKEVTLTSYFDFSQCGSYQVVAEYHNDHDGHEFGWTAWIGELRSSSLEVIVVDKKMSSLGPKGTRNPE